MRKIFLVMVLILVTASTPSHSAESAADIGIILGTVTEDTNAGQKPDKYYSVVLGKLAKDAIVPISGLSEKLKDAQAALDATSKYGLTILQSIISDTSKYTDGTGFKITIGNPSAKSISYISFIVIGYNAANDPVLDPIKLTTEITVRGIGPINKNESMTYDWEYMWNTDLVERFEIKEIKLEYMDGSKRTIKNISEITLSEEHYKTIYEDN